MPTNLTNRRSQTDIELTSPENPWPVRPLARPPGKSGAQVLAARVRSWIGAAGGEPVSLDQIGALARARASTCELSAAHGMEEALLLPLRGDRFAIAVDPTPRGGWERVPGLLRSDLARHRFRFRVGHELGHVFAFWRKPNERPVRHLFDSPAQEAFCDEFSRALLVAPEDARDAARSAAGVRDLQEACDVSLEVAARAFADAHPDLTVALWFMREGEFQPQWASTAAAGLGRARRAAESGRPCALWLEARQQLLFVGPE